MADNHQTQTGRNLVTLGLVIALIGLVMLVVGVDAGTWLAVGGVAIATVGGFTTRAHDEGRGTTG